MKGRVIDAKDDVIQICNNSTDLSLLTSTENEADHLEDLKN